MKTQLLFPFQFRLFQITFDGLSPTEAKACAWLYTFMHGLYLHTTSVRVKQMPKSQHDCSWYFSAIPKGAYLCISNMTWLQRACWPQWIWMKLLVFGWNELHNFIQEVAQIDVSKKMLYNKETSVKSEQLRHTSKGVPPIKVTATLRKVKSPPKGSPIIICRHTSSWILQELQPHPRCPHCTNTDPSPCLQRATPGKCWPCPLATQADPHHSRARACLPSSPLARTASAPSLASSSARDTKPACLLGICPLPGGSGEEVRCFHAPLSTQLFLQSTVFWSLV